MARLSADSGVSEGVSATPTAAGSPGLVAVLCALGARHAPGVDEAVDRYLAEALTSSGVSRSTVVSALGAFNPTSPGWSEPFTELPRRLGAGAQHVRQLPRLADLVTYSRLVRGRPETR